MTYFKPTENRKDVVTSLKEWAARLLEPDVTLILTDAEKDNNTRARFVSAKFILTDRDYKTTGSDDCEDQPTFNTSPDTQKNKTEKELLLNISIGVKSALLSTQKRK